MAMVWVGQMLRCNIGVSTDLGARCSSLSFPRPFTFVILLRRPVNANGARGAQTLASQNDANVRSWPTRGDGGARSRLGSIS